MESDVLFTNGRLLAPAAGDYLPERYVLVRDGRIEEVSSTRPHTDATVFDLDGRVLMPGLCDGHVHVTAITADFHLLNRMSPTYVAARSAHLLRDMLQRGFTTVRDAGGADFGLAQAVAEGFIEGPRLLYCGHAISQTGGHGDVRGPGDANYNDCMCCAGFGTVCDGVPEMRRACREEIRKGATHLKLMVSGGVSSPTDRIDSLQFADEEVRAAVEEAEAAKIPITAHAYTARAINRALECGVDSIEHGNLLDETSAERLVRYGKFLVPTLSIYHSLAREGLEAGLPAELQHKVYEVLDAGTSALEIAHRAGVKIVYGTDLLGQMHRHQLNEFTLRSEVQGPADLIRSATTNAAELFRMEGEIGVIAPGARADLLVVDGDPLEDISVLQDPQRCLRAIMKDGVFHKNTLDVQAAAE